MIHSVLTSNERDNVRSAPSFGNIFLIPQLIKVFLKTERNLTLTDIDKKILSQGKTLVSKMIEGVHVVEKNDVKNLLFPVEEGMSTYGYALDTLCTLQWYDKADKSELFFNHLYKQLEELEKSGTAEEDMDKMKHFFNALGNFFNCKMNSSEYQPPGKFQRFL